MNPKNASQMTYCPTARWIDWSHVGLWVGIRYWVRENTVPRIPSAKIRALSSYRSSRNRPMMAAGEVGSRDKLCSERGFSSAVRVAVRRGVADGAVRVASRRRRALLRVRRMGDAAPVCRDCRGTSRGPPGRWPVRREPHGQDFHRGSDRPRIPGPPERERHPRDLGSGTVYTTPPRRRHDPRRRHRDVPRAGPVLPRVQRGTSVLGRGVAHGTRGPRRRARGPDDRDPVPRGPRAAVSRAPATLHVRGSERRQAVPRSIDRLRPAGPVGGPPAGRSTGNRGVGEPGVPRAYHRTAGGAHRFRWTRRVPRDPHRVHGRAGLRVVPRRARGHLGVGRPRQVRRGPRGAAGRARRAGHPSTGKGLPPLGPRFRRTADAARGEQRLAREMGAAFYWSRGARGPTGTGRLSAARRRSDGGPRNSAARLPRGLPRVRRGPRNERDDVAEPARGDRARLRRQGTRSGGDLPRGRHSRNHASRARRVAPVPLIRTTRSSFARPGETFIWSGLVW